MVVQVPYIQLTESHIASTTEVLVHIAFSIGTLFVPHIFSSWPFPVKKNDPADTLASFYPNFLHSSPHSKEGKRQAGGRWML